MAAEDDWDDWQAPVTPEVLGRGVDQPASQQASEAASERTAEVSAQPDGAGAGARLAAEGPAVQRSAALDDLPAAAEADTPQQQYLRTVLRDLDTPRSHPADDLDDGTGAQPGALGPADEAAAADEAALAAHMAQRRDAAIAQLAFAGREVAGPRPLNPSGNGAAAAAGGAAAGSQDAPEQQPQGLAERSQQAKDARLHAEALQDASELMEAAWDLHAKLKTCAPWPCRSSTACYCGTAAAGTAPVSVCTAGGQAALPSAPARSAKGVAHATVQAPPGLRSGTTLLEADAWPVTR